MRVGCDVVAVDRITRALSREGFATRVFTGRELADATRGDLPLDSPVVAARLAARFAAKEAARKALGDLRLPLRQTEVRTDAGGAPQLWIDGRRSSLAISLSHDGGVAMAVVAGPTDAGPTDHAEDPEEGRCCSTASAC